MNTAAALPKRRSKMKLFQVVPEIHRFEKFRDFAEGFSLGAEDLIITNRYIYEPVISECGCGCMTLFQEEYGSGEPSDVMINGMLRALSGKKFRRIIAVGGGTVIDIAKVIAVAGEETDVNRLFENVSGLKRNAELFIVPTTCGTGSEVTDISIVNRTALGTKQGLVSGELFASHAVLIPEFIATLPYKAFAASSIDAFIHAVESYLSPLATGYTEMFSEKAMSLIIRGYKRVAEDKGSIAECAGDFLTASNYAGIAFGNAGCGTVHAMSYAFGGKYHVAHGESNYQFFIPVFRFYKSKSPDGKIKRFEELLSSELDGGIKGLEELLGRIMDRKPMSAYGATEADVADFAESTVKNQQRLLGRSCVPICEEDIRGIYAACLR